MVWLWLIAGFVDIFILMFGIRALKVSKWQTDTFDALCGLLTVGQIGAVIAYGLYVAHHFLDKLW